jgi:hypothetical protein
MPNDLGYCRRKAAECAERAEETSDTEIHEFLIRMRDVWIAAANRFDLADSSDERKSVAGESAHLQ